MIGNRGVWWEAEEGQVWKRLIPYVQDIDQRQCDYSNRFALCDALYDPNGPAGMAADERLRAELERMTENLIASNVNTVMAQWAPREVRSRFLTNGASWSVAQQAKLTEQYAEEMAKRTKRAAKVRTAAFDTVLKGTGLIKVFADSDNQLCVEPMMIDNVIVDDGECWNGADPRQLHYRQLDRDRDQLMQQFPDSKREIERARGRTSWSVNLPRWREPRGESRNDVFVLETWRLPMGVPDTEGYMPGCHAIVVDGCDLLVEEWHKPRFPVVVMRWEPRRSSFYGISLTERIIGWQRIVNKRGWHMERVLDILAMPTTYVSHADVNLRVQETAIGRVVPLKGGPPTTVTPIVIGPELAADRQYARDGAYRESGVSQMAATSAKPAGLEAGVALREWRDMTTDRFAMQEGSFEQFSLEVDLAILDVCKDLGPDAPKMTEVSKWAPRVLSWADVEYDELEVQISAASTLPRTSAGREQTVLEFVQAGIFSLDEGKAMLDHPDVDKQLSLHTSSRNAIEQDIEGILRGHPVIPESFIDLKMASKLGNSHYLQNRQYKDCPETVLDGLRDYTVRAEHQLEQAKTAAAVAAAPAGVPQLMPGETPVEPGGPPMATPQQVPTAGPPMTTQQPELPA